MTNHIDFFYKVVLIPAELFKGARGHQCSVHKILVWEVLRKNIMLILPHGSWGNVSVDLHDVLFLARSFLLFSRLDLEGRGLRSRSELQVLGACRSCAVTVAFPVRLFQYSMTELGHGTFESHLVYKKSGNQ